MKEELKKELSDLGFSPETKITPEKPTMPEGYFANMQKAVFSEVQPAPAIEQKSKSSWDTFQGILGRLFAPRPALALAGLAAAILFVIFIKPNPETDSLTIVDLTDAATAYYVDNYIDELDEDLLVEFLSTEESFNLESTTTFEDLFIEEALEELDISEIQELL